MAGDALARAAELERAGEPHALATVVRVDRPVSARIGDRAVIGADGRLHGWIGGSCTAPVVTREALAAMADGSARLVRIRPPGSRPEPPQPGVVTEITICSSEGGLDVFVEPRLPRPLLVVVGSSPVARTLAELARLVGHRVTAVLDGPGEQVPAADTTLTVEQLAGARFRPQDAVVVATMNRYDEAAIAAALASGAGYVGLVASRKRGATTLVNLELPPADLERVRSPAGFDLGPATQEEIALSVLAEVVSVRNKQAAAESEDGPEQPCAPDQAEVAPVSEHAHHATAGARGAGASPSRMEIDPICGMTVAVTPDAITATVAGVTTWFCGPGCRDAFLAQQRRAAGER
jgi:xanthine dehydrogenase accessory factor